MQSNAASGIFFYVSDIAFKLKPEGYDIISIPEQISTSRYVRYYLIRNADDFIMVKNLATEKKLYRVLIELDLIESKYLIEQGELF